MKPSSTSTASQRLQAVQSHVVPLQTSSVVERERDEKKERIPFNFEAFKDVPGPHTADELKSIRHEIIKSNHEGSFYLMEHEMSKKYGPICKLPIFYREKGQVGYALQVSDGDETKRLLNINHPKSFTYRSLDPLSGHGVLTNDNQEEWYEQRKQITPGFSWDLLKNNFGFIKTCVQQLRNKVTSYAAANRPFDIHQEFTDLTFLVIQCLLMGDQEFPGISGKELRSTFDIMQQYCIGKLQLKKEEYDHASTVINDLAFKVLNLPENHSKSASSCPMKDVINQATSKFPKDTYLGSDQRRRDELLTVIFAGYETTANTLGFIFHELVLHPEYQEKVSKEVKGYLAAKGKTRCEEVEFGDLYQLKTVTNVIREAQRLWPAIPGGTSRVLQKTEVICGHTIPEGTVLFFPFFTIQRDAKYWADPLKFNPERPWNENYFFTFSKPPRDCAGRNFSLMEMKYAVITLLNGFRFELYSGPESGYYDGSVEKEGVSHAGMKPKGGVWVKAFQRETKK